MAYIDQTAANHRPGAIVGVVAVHAALGFVLVTGLHTEFIETISTGPLPVRNIPIDPPPPPPKPPEQKADPNPAQPKSRDVVIPPAPIPLPQPGPTLDASEIILPPSPPMPKVDPGIGSGIGDQLAPLPKPTPPGLDPISAKPRNDPSRWVSTNDYPSVSVREEQEGTARFVVTINEKGRVEDCRITKSSGHSRLDAATCKFVERRARFTPARDRSGEKTTDTYTSSVLWQLPE